mmetsp:Transcript_83436/g.257956  ORF Transcript_83436/g.257956 Transcript_83436/m.257956 type:complete len:213 (+) Transcript_83436:622-1260(+)
MALGQKHRPVRTRAASAPSIAPPRMPSLRTCRTSFRAIAPMARLIFTSTTSSRNWKTSLIGVRKASAASSEFLVGTVSFLWVTFATTTIAVTLTLSAAQKARCGKAFRMRAPKSSRRPAGAAPLPSASAAAFRLALQRWATRRAYIGVKRTAGQSMAFNILPWLAPSSTTLDCVQQEPTLCREQDAPGKTHRPVSGSSCAGTSVRVPSCERL